ncbi:MAG TPA: 50S ribosomal protein L24 [Desulfobulbaceae bacterium]|nr:50S ribosomal protein L24 [Desulfobulbaceae bacterium]
MNAGRNYLKKNDQVEVITGRDKGSVGKILKVLPDRNAVIVERVNVMKRHMKSRQQGQPGQIVEKEAPVDVSNVQIICPGCAATGRIAKKILEDGTKVRVCKHCGESLDGKR